MDLITVSCNQCSAPLEVSTSSRFVTCSFCQSRLEIHRSESAAFTSVLDELKQQADTIERDVFVIRKQNELAQLDREWEAAKERPQENHRGSGNPMGVIMAFLVLGVFAILGIPVMRINPLFGLMWMIIVVSIGAQVVSSISRKSIQAPSEAVYRERREDLLREIEEQRRA